MDGPLGSRISARTWGALLLPPVVLVLLAWILSPFLRGHPAGWLCAAGLAAVACALPVLLLRRAAVVSDEPLIRAASRWGRGELEYRIDGPRLARLGPLAAALNRMASSLQVRDETARLRAAERLQQSEKLATVGQLAAGVAHEINNPIGGILLYGNLLVESTQPDDPRYENMKKIVGQASRARRSSAACSTSRGRTRLASSGSI
ncbi:MAG: histidine kinase dimerization/phospho-acceptor domain-containing protein [Candidatus Eisenbacteria bacterium]|nr:histidine kinase dimerization/phospho-acceptor domain-containing protein [Candidatus Eisenbacteria bacterium]